MHSAEVLKVKLYFSLIFLDTFFIHLFSFLSEEIHHLNFLILHVRDTLLHNVYTRQEGVSLSVAC